MYDNCKKILLHKNWFIRHVKQVHDEKDTFIINLIHPEYRYYKSFWEEELTRIGTLKDVTASSNRIENKFCIVLPKCNKCLFA